MLLQEGKNQIVMYNPETSINVEIKLKIDKLAAELQPSPKHWQTVSIWWSLSTE